jgi:hypothetical protein
MTFLNPDSSEHSDRESASQAFLDALASLDETFGDSGSLDLVPDPARSNPRPPSQPSFFSRDHISGSDQTSEP